jgi:hypothetical protein
MTDYHPLIARAVDGLTKNTGDARRALYERARSALVAQLRGVDPALSESDITKERLALEEAIRKVEAEASRKALAEPKSSSSARTEPRFEIRSPVSPPRPAAEPSLPLPRLDDARDEEKPKSTARSRILQARTSPLNKPSLGRSRGTEDDTDSLGAAIAKAAQEARDSDDSYDTYSRSRGSQANDFSQVSPAQERMESRYGDGLQPMDDVSPELSGLEPSYTLEDEPEGPPRRSGRPHPPRTVEEEAYEDRRPPRSLWDWARIAVLLLIVVGVGATAWEYRYSIAGIYQFFSQLRSRQPAQSTQAPATPNKFSGRVPQEQVPGQAPAAAGALNTQAGSSGAQRAVLYEADPNDPAGKRFAGTTVWRTETVSPGPGMAPELVVRADIQIPERHMSVTWSLRRNTDKTLPASHTIEVMFNLPPDFPGGGISNVPGILMKDSEEVRGMPLAGLAVKVTNGFFLIGLNAADAEMQRNVQLLKERAWFDILIVYANGGRAILTMEKGPAGERAFADAFAAWGR